MPRLLQKALRLSREEEGEHPHSEGNGRKIASRGKTNRIGAGLPSSGSARLVSET